MKKTVYIFLIIICAMMNSLLINDINNHCYIIIKNIEESWDFRKMDIDYKMINNAKLIADKYDKHVSEIIAPLSLKNDLSLKNQKINYSTWEKINLGYARQNNDNYKQVKNILSAIFDDLKYFPVAFGSKNEYWVSYEDSYGTDRNYKGKYIHEGTDIMAEHNVSGYYPIVSVTDGVVENIGWLPKGGYRVGIRADCGGYFYYAHLSEYADIKKGDKITAGTLLGYMGDTGYGMLEGTRGNFAVHLHFGVYVKTEHYEEQSINPYNILKYLDNKLIIANY